MMFYKKVILVFLLIFSCFKGFTAVFVVTSNADSGPGTLREALTLAAANGTAEKDYINFNLPDLSEAGRTITILSQLPFVSSNLVIDGTTQPGSKLGRSDAKIILQPGVKNIDSYSPLFHLFVLLNIDGFELYGVSMRDFLGYVPTGQNSNYADAIYIEASTNIRIGAPGKGNVFANNTYNISTAGVAMKDGVSPPEFGAGDLKICSNFFGFEPDGKTFRGRVLGYVGGIDISACKGNIEIGGDDPAKRNIFGDGAMYIEQAYTVRKNAFPSTILIKNNFFNYDVDGNPTAIADFNGPEIYAMAMARNNEAYTFDKVTYPYTINIMNNKVEYPCSMTCGFISGNFTMQGNNLLYEPSIALAHTGGGIGASSDGNILIGGEKPGEANVLYGEEIDLFSRKSVLIQRNSIYCVGDFRGIYYPLVPYLDPPLPLPVISIKNITAQSVAGTATPLSKVELFWDDDCSYCEPLTYVATVNADANGNWHYDGTIKTGVVASATFNGFTSLFTKAASLNGRNILHYSCNSKGSITGIAFTNTGGYQWKNGKGEIISTDPDVKNLLPGQYTLTALNGSCSSNFSYSIFDATPKINVSLQVITSPTCSKNTGSITGIYLDNADVINEAYAEGNYTVYTYKWIDAGGNIKTNKLDLIDVEPGTYHLEVTYGNTCTMSYGPIILTNKDGLNVDESKAIETATKCGEATGSIKNIIITGSIGTVTFIWYDSLHNQVGSGQDLTNQPAGTYELQVTDASQCGPAYTTPLQIPESNGITLDETKFEEHDAGCSNNDGYVKGILAPSATQYQWVDANNKPVGNALDLINIGEGDYTLTASIGIGCPKTSRPYHVGRPVGTQYPAYSHTITSACFGDNNGSVTVVIDGLVKNLRWIDSKGQLAGNQAMLTNIAAGTYQLYLTDANGCESFYDKYVVDELPQLAVGANGNITSDQCGLKNGSVSTTTLAGGLPPYTYKWLDVNGTQIGSNNAIFGLAAGSYKLNVIDSRCGNVDIAYTIPGDTENIPAPAVSNIQLCTAGNAVIVVNSSSAIVTYRLYDTQTSIQPLDAQNNGRFNVSITGNRSFYISAMIGACESARSEVKVTVGLSTLNIINTFSPNGDGVNDYWKINGIESNPYAIVQVFTRYGQKVFESKGYSIPFDGTFNGKKLPSGVYYYIINLGTNCSLLSGSLTIIR